MTEDDVERVALAICHAQTELPALAPSKRGEHQARAMIAAHEQALADAGMVVLPREPTEVMLRNPKWAYAPSFMEWAWKVMIDAYAPTPGMAPDDGESDG